MSKQVTLHLHVMATLAAPAMQFTLQQPIYTRTRARRAAAKLIYKIIIIPFMPLTCLYLHSSCARPSLIYSSYSDL